MFCSKCGKSIAENAKFCEQCGNAIVGVENQPQQRTEKPLNNGKAKYGFVLGISSMILILIIAVYSLLVYVGIMYFAGDIEFGVFLALLGIPISITGLILSFLGLNSEKRERAIIGAVLNILYLVILIILGTNEGIINELFY